MQQNLSIQELLDSELVDINIQKLDLFGKISSKYNNKIILDQLEEIDVLLEESKLIWDKDDRVFLVKLKNDTGYERVVVKKFKPSSWGKTLFDKFFNGGSEAERSIKFANYLCQKKVGTPAPIAYLVKRAHGRILESYAITEYVSDNTSEEQLNKIIHDFPDNITIMKLLNYIAINIRNMHDCGFVHGDLGLQNIFVNKCNESDWNRFRVFDCSRGKVSINISLKHRAKDLARLWMPLPYVHFFACMYFKDTVPPKKFTRYLLRYHSCYKLYRYSYLSSWLRKPIKSFKKKLPFFGYIRHYYASLKDIWFWDEKSSQPMITMSRKEKNRQRSFLKNYLPIIKSLILNKRKVDKKYKELICSSFKGPVDISQKIGIAIHPYSDYIENEVKLLAELGNPPVIVRIRRDEYQEQWHKTVKLICDFHDKGINVVVALLQDRKSILNLELWKEFLAVIIPKIHDKVQWLEVGHAINRVKWGIWSYDQYANLFNAVAYYRYTYPNLKLVGPATIDFEWHQVMTALDIMPKDSNLFALSQHLYVDRRGAPENFQGRFSTLEKVSWLKAIADTSTKCANKFIISEFNWPLKNTGEYSPTMCPYVPEGAIDNLGVSEEDYAIYTLRFIAIAICSGHVDSLYCWRLSAHGYGLVDDLNGCWRKRPAFFAMKYFLNILGKSTFTHKVESPDNTYILMFKVKQQNIAMVWGNNSDARIDYPFEFSNAYDYVGSELKLSKNKLTFTNAPIYYFL